MRCITSSLMTGLLLGVVTRHALGQRSITRNDVAAPTGITFAYTPSALTINWPSVAGALRYSAVRRLGTVVEQLGDSPTNAFVLPVPQPGVTYEYQITAVGRIASAASAWFPYTVPLETTVIAAPVQPATGGTGMVTYAGPSSLAAISPAPGQMQLAWSPVPNALGYRIRRSNTGGEAEHDYMRLGATPTSWLDLRVDSRWTYSYKVLAYIAPNGTEILTAPSPVASRSPLPFVQVSGLTYTFVPSVKSPGRLDVTIKWNAVNLVEKYRVVDETWAAAKEFPATTTSYVQPGVPLKYTFRVCVGAIYPYNVRQDNTAPCIDIKT